MHGFPYDIYAYKNIVQILKKKDLVIYATEAEIIKELKKCYRFYNVTW